MVLTTFFLDRSEVRLVVGRQVNLRWFVRFLDQSDHGLWLGRYDRGHGIVLNGNGNRQEWRRIRHWHEGLFDQLFRLVAFVLRKKCDKVADEIRMVVEENPDLPISPFSGYYLLDDPCQVNLSSGEAA